MRASPTDADIFRFLQGFVAERGYIPTLGQIGAALGLSKSAVKRRLDRLEQYGAIARSRTSSGRQRACGIELLVAPRPDLDTVRNLLFVFEQIDAMRKKPPSTKEQ